MACGNTYTPEQADLASRSRTDLRHPTSTAELPKDRRQAISNSLKKVEFESKGHQELPRLHIFKNDKIRIDKTGDVLITRPAAGGLGTKPPIGVAFAHSLKSGYYKGFSIKKVETVKHEILKGERTEFHFVTSSSFPNDVRRAIKAANDELRENGKGDHLINFHSKKDYPFAS
ncbi:MAG: hypothetical protein CMJ50_08970 [Planctomycetaceae bacterium]|jgi:hypothetical protein|nr:hypothetical protein [Planctomycetaceae bacterium]